VGFEVISSVFVVLREIYYHLVNEHVRSEFDLCCCLEEGNDRELSLLMCLFVCHHSSFLENESYSLLLLLQDFNRNLMAVCGQLRRGCSSDKMGR
jgi:hypothetical protein